MSMKWGSRRAVSAALRRNRLGAAASNRCAWPCSVGCGVKRLSSAKAEPESTAEIRILPPSNHGCESEPFGCTACLRRARVAADRSVYEYVLKHSNYSHVAGDAK